MRVYEGLHCGLSFIGWASEDQPGTVPASFSMKQRRGSVTEDSWGGGETWSSGMGRNLALERSRPEA
jgi:hypothetical protein